MPRNEARTIEVEKWSGWRKDGDTRPVAKNRGPRTLRETPRRPPVMAVPPMTTTAIEFKMKGGPTVGSPVDVFAARKRPARALHPPDSAYVRNLARHTCTPVSRAASASL